MERYVFWKEKNYVSYFFPELWFLISGKSRKLVYPLKLIEPLLVGFKLISSL
jgi:hypothetical protein